MIYKNYDCQCKKLFIKKNDFPNEVVEVGLGKEANVKLSYNKDSSMIYKAIIEVGLIGFDVKVGDINQGTKIAEFKSNVNQTSIYFEFAAEYELIFELNVNHSEYEEKDLANIAKRVSIPYLESDLIYMFGKLRLPVPNIQDLLEG